VADLGDVERMVDEWERDATAKSQRYQAMQEQVAQLSIAASAANGAVTVTVGNNGIPTAIAMTDAIHKLTADQVATAVLTAMQKAQSQYPQRMQEIMAATVGDDDTSRHILAAAAATFPPPPPEDTPEPPRHEPGRRLNIDLDDDEEPPPARPAAPARKPRSRSGDEGDEGFADQLFPHRT
jgi:DNA-binding protein YbaB